MFEKKNKNSVFKVKMKWKPRYPLLSPQWNSIWKVGLCYEIFEAERHLSFFFLHFNVPFSASFSLIFLTFQVPFAASSQLPLLPSLLAGCRILQEVFWRVGQCWFMCSYCWAHGCHSMEMLSALSNLFIFVLFWQFIFLLFLFFYCYYSFKIVRVYMKFLFFQGFCVKCIPKWNSL